MWKVLISSPICRIGRSWLPHIYATDVRKQGKSFIITKIIVVTDFDGTNYYGGSTLNTATSMSEENSSYLKVSS